MKHLKSLSAIFLATTMAVTGCNANNFDEQKSGLGETAKGGDLTILTSGTEMDMDPGKSQGLAITSLGLVARRLTTWKIQPDATPEVVPDLATDTGTPSEDGKTWTFTLKDGVTFEDGTPITSKDIKYGIERSFAKELSGGLSYHKTLLKGADKYAGPFDGKELDSIETPDDKTIVFHLNEAFGDWPWIASMPAFTPVPKDKDKPAEYGNAPVASGPYRVESNTPGTSMVLKRNDNWNQDTDKVRTAGPDTITFKMSQDPTVAAQSLISDSSEAQTSFGADFIPAAQLAQAQKNPSAKSRLVTSGDGALKYLAINTERISDADVRKALNYAVDKNAVRIASGGEISGSFASTLISPGIPGRQEYNLYEAPDSGDAEKAKQLLEGKDVGTLTLLTRNDPISSAQAQAISQSLSKAGVKVRIKAEDTNSFSADATQGEGDYDLALSSWQPDFPSANANIEPLFASSQIGNGNYNISRYSNPKVDDMISKATHTIDDNEAQKLWAEVDKAIMEDAPVVPLMYTKNSFMHGSKVENFIIGSFPAYPNYLKVSLSQ